MDGRSKVAWLVLAYLLAEVILPRRLNTMMPAINGPHFPSERSFVHTESTVVAEQSTDQTAILLFSTRNFSGSCPGAP